MKNKVSKPAKKSHPRLYVLLAKNSSEAIVIRRGPSMRVQLARWDRSSDKFELGQWFKGRVYERRCDISPSGRHFLYFAANHKPPYGTWTAISRVPYFKALALWPKGDAWGGGGLFADDNTLMLNHGENQLQMSDDSKLAPKIEVQQLHLHAGRGEDNPIYHMHLLRDGWQETEYIDRIAEPASNLMYPFNPPLEYRKPFYFSSNNFCNLHMIIRGLFEVNGPWYVVDYYVADADGRLLCTLGRIDWADWDSNGDLLFANSGSIFRMKKLDQSPYVGEVESAIELIDFSEFKFEAVPAPEQASNW